jgi:hypothetical protein
MALLTAQRMGEEITSEATKTKNEMLQKAEDEIREKFAETSKRCADEELRLAAASKETAKFIEVSQAIMRKHSEFLEKLEAARSSINPKDTAGQAAKAGKTQKATQQARTAPPPAKPAQPAQPMPQAQPAYPVQPMPQAQPAYHPAQPMPPVQSVSPMPPVQPAGPPVQAAPPDIYSQATQQVPVITQPVMASEVEIDDIAMQIGTAVEKITEVEVKPIEPTAEVRPPAFDEPPASLFEDDDDSIRLYNPESELEETSPRPKFDFDDLKFGANFDTDD